MRSNNPKRVGVLFGGRSGEHEVSLASARNVMDSLAQAGHTVIPLGITRSGRWLTGNDPLAQLTTASQALGSGASDHRDPAPLSEASKNEDASGWALIPSGREDANLRQVDVIFPVLHGPFGEDGTVQGLLEMANVPYVGCGVLASAVGMDKVLCKQVFATAGLSQPAYVPVLRSAWRTDPEAVLARIEAALAYPLFVKPANMGSSIGISRAEDASGLSRAMDVAARYDRRLLVEEAVPNAREIEVSVLGNEDPIASVAGEIIPGNDFYDYAAKYLDNSSGIQIPAQLTDDQSRRIRQMAVDAFLAVDGAGLTRVDFLLNAKSGEIFINEINTLPGFTPISMYPKLWAATGMSYPELVDRLVQLALERHADREQTSTLRSA